MSRCSSSLVRAASASCQWLLSGSLASASAASAPSSLVARSFGGVRGLATKASELTVPATAHRHRPSPQFHLTFYNQYPPPSACSQLAVVPREEPQVALNTAGLPPPWVPPPNNPQSLQPRARPSPQEVLASIRQVRGVSCIHAEGSSLLDTPMGQLRSTPKPLPTASRACAAIPCQPGQSPSSVWHPSNGLIWCHSPGQYHAPSSGHWCSLALMPVEPPHGPSLQRRPQPPWTCTTPTAAGPATYRPQSPPPSSHACRNCCLRTPPALPSPPQPPSQASSRSSRPRLRPRAPAGCVSRPNSRRACLAWRRCCGRSAPPGTSSCTCMEPGSWRRACAPPQRPA